jgi:hypothetical protein
VAKERHPDGSESCLTLANIEKNKIDVDHFILDEHKSDGIKIHYAGNETCDDFRNYDLTIDIKCDKDA